MIKLIIHTILSIDIICDKIDNNNNNAYKPLFLANIDKKKQ